MKKISAAIIIIIAIIISSLLPVAADEAGSASIELDSGAERGAGFISVNEQFTGRNGNEYSLIMYGLKEQNKEAMVNVLEQYYDPDSRETLTIYDNAFADAEKYDTYADYWSENDNDSEQCWAAAVADMLWMGGWAEHFINPETGNLFDSEDDVFRYYNTKISNGGCSNTANGIDWFFMGELYNMTYYGPVAHIIKADDREAGVLKSFVSSFVQAKYDLINRPESIMELEKCGWDDSSGAVFQLSIGALLEGEICISEHAVTAAGIITDPNTESFQDRYKDILIIDSDNNADPEKEEGRIENLTIEQKNALKEARPNSVTVYNLEYITDVNGVPCWELAGYGADSEYDDAWIIYSINELSVYSEDIISAYTETEGTQAVCENVDLTLESMFTTDSPEAITDLYNKDPEELTVTCFAPGEAVNLNFFIANRSGILLDEDYTDGKELTADWKVIRDADGTVAAEGRTVCELPLYPGIEMGFMANLNGDGDSPAAWDPGTYTVYLDLNADRAVTEAYYRNNLLTEAHFTITE